MTADRIFCNARVFTSMPDRPYVAAIAIAGDRIVATGDDEEVLVHAGPGTLVHRLDGQMITPGFIDAHVHPAMSGLDKLRVDFEGVDDARGAYRVIGDYAQRHPDLSWIIGSGWSQSWFPRGCPDREDLDRLVPDRPAILWNTDGHGAWVNTAALIAAGIDSDTSDPVDGRIERRSDGSPQGTLHEGAVDLVASVAPPDTVDDIEMGLMRGQQELLSYGITGWQDAIVRPDIQAAYLRLASDGRLKGRVVGALWWDRDRGLEQIDDLVERRGHDGPRFRPTSVKLMLDGVCENFTAAMIDPWLGPDGTATANSGIDFIERRILLEAVPRLDALGFQCHFHAIGDRAVRNALDAIEAARMANGPSDNRHHIAHIQVIHPDDIPRFASLGGVANAQPLWACHDTYQDDLTIPFLGPERSGWQYPFRSLLDAGAQLGMGSDWGVSTANVMAEVDMAVTRQLEDKPVFLPEQRLTFEEAVTAFTAGSAYINHAEHDTGRLGVGMLADLVVLDRDPLGSGPIRETRVSATIIGGEVVYEES